DMDGRPITQAFERKPDVQMIPSWDEVQGDDGQHPPDKSLTAEESRQAIDQLVALGYIEPPNENIGVAISETQRELDYNLARAYMDGARHGDAIPLLVKLYQESPLEFRFGIRLATCLQALDYVDELEDLVNDLRYRWQRAAVVAQERLREFTKIARERKTLMQEAKDKLPEPENDESRPLDRLFNPMELRVIKTTRAIARGNPSTLDYLAGWVAISRDNPQSALEHFQNARETQSEFPGFHFQLGEAFRRLGQYEDATKSFAKVLEIDPHSSSSYLGLARVYLSLDENEKAMKAAKAAVGLKYDLPPAHYCIGMCSARTGNLDRAIQAFETALSQNPNFSEAHLELAQIYEKLGEHNEARYHENTGKSIDEERKKHASERIIPELASSETIDYQESLPKFPEQDTSVSRVPFLGVPAEVAAKVSIEQDASDEIIYVVSGLPRSGTSMMMQMLAAGGIAPLTDEIREADLSNPRGYFELDKIKNLAQVNDWLAEAQGKTIKVVAPLIPFLPLRHNYRVILMDRNLDEIVMSQNQMLKDEANADDRLDDEKLKSFLSGQINVAEKALQGHDVPYLKVSYASCIENPVHATQQVADFLATDLNVTAMGQVIDANLHRQRSQSSGTQAG
ncbi:MAG: tetratricopeptide repeat protein, partial [Pirellulaceae bacterium]